MSINLDEILLENVIKPYRVIVDIYTKKHFVEPCFKKPIKDFLSMIKNGKKKILDIGCGPGGESKVLIDNGCVVTGIDITPEMLEMSKKKVPEAKFIKMDSRKLKFKNKEFDGIWSARTLIHIPSSEMTETLKGWRRVLKKGGILAACVLLGRGEGIEREYYDPSGKTKTFFHYFTKEELEGNIKEAGFSVIKSYVVMRDDNGEEEPHLFVFGKNRLQ